MPNNWKKYKLSEITEYIGRGISPKYTEEGGIPIINQRCIRENKVIYETCRFHNVDKKKITDFKYLKKYDVLVNSTGVGTLGRVAQYKQDLGEISVDSHVSIVRPKPEFRDKFFGFAVIANQKRIEALGEGSTGQTELSRIRLGEDIELNVPESKKEREAIASILSALDDKIELNLQMNKTFEEMAMALYKHWFVDFGPFQNEKFISSELGEIPEGWEVRSIYSVANFINGAAFKPKDLLENNNQALPVIKIAEIKQGITSQTKYSDRKLDNKYFISNGDILFPWSGNPHTSLGIHIWDKGDALLNQHIFVVRTEDAGQKCLVFNLLKYQLPTFINLATHKQTTGLGHITVANLKELQIPYPTKEVIEKYNEEALPIFDLIYNNQLENITLTKLRDTLLPKLISGEVRVKQAEEILSNAL